MGPDGKPGRNGVDGKDGKDGRNGVDGKSIVGPAGKDAKLSLGSVTSGETASATLREVDGVQVLSLVLPRGEKGADSTVQGLQGNPGKDGMSEDDVINLVVRAVIDDPSLLDRATAKLACVENWVEQVLRRISNATHPDVHKVMEDLRQHLRK